MNDRSIDPTAPKCVISVPKECQAACTEKKLTPISLYV